MLFRSGVDLEDIAVALERQALLSQAAPPPDSSPSFTLRSIQQCSDAINQGIDAGKSEISEGVNELEKLLPKIAKLLPEPVKIKAIEGAVTPEVKAATGIDLGPLFNAGGDRKPNRKVQAGTDSSVELIDFGIGAILNGILEQSLQEERK